MLQMQDLKFELAREREAKLNAVEALKRETEVSKALFCEVSE